MAARKYEGYLTTREAGNLAQHDRRTIVNWINSGALPAVRRGPGGRSHYLVREEDLKRLLPHLKTEERDDQTQADTQPES